MLLSSTWRWLATTGLLVANTALAALPPVDFNDDKSIAAAAKIVAQNLLSYYPPYASNPPGWTLGILPGPPPSPEASYTGSWWYWWQAGALWGTMIDYRHQTGDHSFDKWITEALLAQVGDKLDFNPRNWSLSMGNDDQAFWAMAALGAAETGYPNPPKESPQWLALAQGTLHSQMKMSRRVAEDSNTPCAWGLRWQVFATNRGFDYINTISNGCFMNMAARVGRYTGNNTYLAWAERTYDFMHRLGYISDAYDVYDGAHEPKQCRDINHLTYSYNAAILLQSSAYMFNATNGADKWRRQIDGLLNRTLISFFGDSGIPVERNCEEAQRGCNTDMRSFKGYLHRWMASTMKLAPYTEPIIMPVLRSSAAAAVATCTGGSNGQLCGYNWRPGLDVKVVHQPGAAEQMNVLGALLSVMKTSSYKAPLTGTSGGSSTPNYGAGLGSDGDPNQFRFRPITVADRAGAGLATAGLVGVFAGLMTWINWDQLGGGPAFLPSSIYG